MADFDLNDVKLAIDLFKQSIGLYKSAQDLLPDSDQKAAASQTLEQAETQLKIAEAKLAQGLGFQVCPKCWPPVVMPAVMVSRNVDRFLCPQCDSMFLNHGKRHNTVKLQETTNESEIEPPD